MRMNEVVRSYIFSFIIMTPQQIFLMHIYKNDSMGICALVNYRLGKKMGRDISVLLTILFAEPRLSAWHIVGSPQGLLESIICLQCAG